MSFYSTQLQNQHTHTHTHTHTYLGITKARPAQQDNVGATPNRSVCLENGLMHVLKRMMPTTASSRPLQHHNDVGVLVGNSDRVVDRVD